MKKITFLLAFVMFFTTISSSALAFENNFSENTVNLENLKEKNISDPSLDKDDYPKEPIKEDISLVKDIKVKSNRSFRSYNNKELSKDFNLQPLRGQSELYSSPITPPASGNVVEISSLDDLIAELEPVEEQKLHNSYRTKSLMLKSNNYKLTNDIEIDLSNEFFVQNWDYAENGLLSFGNSYNDTHTYNYGYFEKENFTFDGNGHTITIKDSVSNQPCVGLFGRIIAKNLNIKNINLVVDGDVLSFPFIERTDAGFYTNDEGNDVASGLIENIKVDVKGRVLPRYVDNIMRIANPQIATPTQKGYIAAGFGIKLTSTNLSNIDVNVSGDIGSIDTVANNNDFSGAFGFLWAYSDLTGNTASNPPTYKRAKDSGNFNLFKDFGYIENLKLNIGGSILAASNDGFAYATGVVYDASHAWIDNADVNIKGDIKVKLSGSCPFSASSPSVDGFSNEILNLTNSKLKVRELSLETSDDYIYAQNSSSIPKIVRVSGLGSDNSRGLFINIKANKIEIDKIYAKSPLNILATSFFYNGWSSSSYKGVDFDQDIKGNNIKVGKIDLTQSSNSNLQYYGFAEKCRTGLSDDPNKPLKEVSARNNKLTVDSLKVNNQGGSSLVYPAFYTASNAKNNEISYKDINIISPSGSFAGLGNVDNSSPSEDNGIEEITEENKLKFGNINISGIDFSRISLMAGDVDAGKVLKNNKLEADNVDVKLLAINSQGQISASNSRPLYFGGISNLNYGEITGNRLFIKNLNLINSSNTYFGLGNSFAKGKALDNSILLDNDTNIQIIGSIYGGVFAGYTNGANFSNNHIQSNGVLKVGVVRGAQRNFGAFGGWLKNTNVKDSTALIFNGYLPFIYAMDGGELDHIAHYSDDGNWKFHSGLLTTIKNNNKATIKNSTYLVDKTYKGQDKDGNIVDKNNENSIVYRDDNVTSDSTNNYIVIVDTSKKDGVYNRAAYSLEKRTSTVDEMGNRTPIVWAKGKDSKPAYEINIAGREFQDKFWDDNSAIYKTGEAEKEFIYMNENPKNLDIKVLGTDKDIISNDKSKAMISDYLYRHAGLYVDNGPIMDLLGIKGHPIIKIDPPKPIERETVRFDKNDPSPNIIHEIKVEKGNALKDTFPQNPIRKGYTFIEWNTKKDGSGDAFTKDTVVLNSITVYAIWEDNEIEFEPSDNTKTFPVIANASKEKFKLHKKYIYGYPEGIFKPNGDITRAEVFAIIARGENYNLDDLSKPNFSDAKEKAWYNKYINACNKAGILKEKETEALRADEAITRAEMADLISRITNKNTKKSDFTDIKNHWAEDAINQGYGNGILTGYPDRTFKPDSTITRAETIIIVNSIYDRYPDKEFINSNKNNLTKYKDLDENHWAYYQIMEASESHEFVYNSPKSEIWKRLIK